jgi:hypothetical protein
MLWLAWLAPALAAVQATGAVPRRISLRYDRALVAADFPNPAARLTINGRSAWFLFDTGAGVHVLASWYAAAAGLAVDQEVGPVVRGSDSTGRALKFRHVRNATARLDDGSLVILRQTAVSDFPPDFERSKIGGVISPQLLAGRGEAAALDLRIPELRIERFDDALRRLGARRLLRDQVRFCGSADAEIANLLYAVRVAVGQREGTLVLDTGAKVTAVRAKSGLARGLRRAPGGTTTGISGRPHAYSVARRSTVAFAGYRRTLDVRLTDAKAAACGSDGLLGVDAVGGCALVLGREDAAITCGQ